ncbi:hypothetical protein FNF_02871 [Fusobacterium necrophorum subsp. funduliforme B35]|nr:hypothetical protein FNF_02871 [Fusobacterium necrophorum subsp. funduliforme B35]
MMKKEEKSLRVAQRGSKNCSLEKSACMEIHFFFFLPFWILNGEIPLKFILFEKNMRRFQPFIKKETREIT